MKEKVAIEFLLTYAWAILIIIAVIAALFYFEVFDISRLSKDSEEYFVSDEKIAGFKYGCTYYCGLTTNNSNCSRYCDKYSGWYSEGTEYTEEHMQEVILVYNGIR